MEAGFHAGKARHHAWGRLLPVWDSVQEASHALEQQAANRLHRKDGPRSWEVSSDRAIHARSHCVNINGGEMGETVTAIPDRLVLNLFQAVRQTCHSRQRGPHSYSHASVLFHTWIATIPFCRAFRLSNEKAVTQAFTT